MPLTRLLLRTRSWDRESRAAVKERGRGRKSGRCDASARSGNGETPLKRPSYEAPACAPEASSTGGCLDALTAELARGADAIAANDLLAIQQSIARQQTMCAALAERLAASEDEAGQDTRHGNCSPAAERLHSAVDQYSALLSHAMRTVGMLQSLHQSQAGSFGESPMPPGAFSCRG